ncbi:MarR family transcriptional regulator [Brachybacterium paraconglomeratum]|uniref:MarR family transcriptional regulator n=1 Tax=Brachybacterium paraconglomeratum TaxID=173362 RepID=UPI00223BC8DA|nr:MarR family transcriptional regulator [Brachybacterium paraconglomeratum]MCT1436241.1 MarR family transcriptional regulator [Brachybacterium paraconglomeratum]
MTAAPLGSQALLLALRRLRTDLAAHDRAVADAAGIKDSDLTVLEILNREGPQTPSVLARRTNTHLATMTGVLTRLEKDGWIERHPDAKDRRSIRIHATSIDRFNTLYAESMDRLAAVFETRPTEHARIFLSAVADISQALDSATDSDAAGPRKNGHDSVIAS